jgi:hypothetical protein
MNERGDLDDLKEGTWTVWGSLCNRWSPVQAGTVRKAWINATIKDERRFRLNGI